MVRLTMIIVMIARIKYLRLDFIVLQLIDGSFGFRGLTVAQKLFLFVLSKENDGHWD